MTFPTAADLTRRQALLGGCALALTPMHRAIGQTAEAQIALRAALADVPLVPGDIALRAAAFNAGAPGPILTPIRSAATRIALSNATDFAFSLDFIGIRGRSASLEATPFIPPGETRLITLSPPDAGTFLYRATTAGGGGATALLSGPGVIEGDGPPIADREVVLALNSFLMPGDPLEPQPVAEAEAGDTAIDAPEPAPRRISTVNGLPELGFAARPGERLRMRLANLADRQLAALRFEGSPRVVAIDGQPCPPFPPLADRIVLPPLGRMDVMITVPLMGAREVVVRDEFRSDALVQIAVEGPALGSRFLAETLPQNPALPRAIPLEKARRATVALGEPLDGEKPLVAARRGETVVLAFENKRAVLFVAHIAGHSARLLDGLDDGWKPWWHDTVLVHPGQTARLAFVADVPGDYPVTAKPIGGDDIPEARGMLRVI